MAVPKKKSKSKARIKVTKIEKLAPNKVALALEVEDAPELPVETIAEPIEITAEPEQPESQGLVKWLKSLW